MPARQFRHLHTLTLLYITVQLVCDPTAAKLVDVASIPLSITIFYFPFTFIFADVLTEVYGYGAARKVIWEVMLCSILAGLLFQFVVLYPPSAQFHNDGAYVTVFSQVPQFLLGGWI